MAACLANRPDVVRLVKHAHLQRSHLHTCSRGDPGDFGTQITGIHEGPAHVETSCKTVQERARSNLQDRNPASLKLVDRNLARKHNFLQYFKMQEGILQEKCSNPRFYVQTSCKKKILQEYSKILAYDVLAVINLARRELTKHVSCYW